MGLDRRPAASLLPAGRGGGRQGSGCGAPFYEFDVEKVKAGHCSDRGHRRLQSVQKRGAGTVLRTVQAALCGDRKKTAHQKQTDERTAVRHRNENKERKKDGNGVTRIGDRYCSAGVAEHIRCRTDESVHQELDGKEQTKKYHVLKIERDAQYVPGFFPCILQSVQNERRTEERTWADDDAGDVIGPYRSCLELRRIDVFFL